MRGGQQSSPAALQKRRKIAKTVRLNHLRAALLEVAAAGLAGLLAAVGLVTVFYAKPAEANYPGKPGKIYYSGWEDRSGKRNQDIYTIRTDGRASSNSLATIEREIPACLLTKRQSDSLYVATDDEHDWEIYTK